MNSILQDLRFALRQFRHAPGFSATIILTLALGVGAATAMFSVLDAALLRPLPFAHQDRIVAVNLRSPAGYSQPFSYPDYGDTRQQMTTFAAMSGFIPGNTTLQRPAGDPTVVRWIQTGDAFFDVLGIKPLIGRGFLPGEEQSGRNEIVVLSYEVWQEDFGGDRNVLGHAAHINGKPMTIIGVMPSGFRYPLSAQHSIYTPFQIPDVWKSNRGSHWMRGFALLKQGVTHEQATAQMNQTRGNLAKAYPDNDAGITARILPLADSEEAGGTAAKPLRLLALATLALLGIACINVSGLLLARGIKREREMALRSAVGADRARLARQLLTEALLLSSAAALLGIGLGYVLLAVMRTFLVHALVRGTDIHMEGVALLVAVALSMASSVLAALLPALRLSQVAPAKSLRSGGSAGTSRGQQRLRSGFVSTQVALSLVLLSISGLLLRSLQQTMRVTLGFDPDRILAVDLNLPAGEYESRDPLADFYAPVLERIHALPGVAGAGLTNMLPVREWGSNSDIHIAGQPPYPKNQEMLAEQRFVSSGYMAAMGAHLVAGRPLLAALDTPDLKAGNVIVNHAFQRKFFPAGGDPVGEHLDDDPANRTAIVGEYTDLRQNLRKPPLAEMDTLIDQLPVKDRQYWLGGLVLVVRTPGDPKTLIGPIRAAVRAVDPTVPFDRAQTMREVMLGEMLFESMESRLFGIFAALAALLSLVGLAGTVQHEVELRTREIGVRMALGASRRRMQRSVLHRTAVLLAAGITAGLLLSLAMQRVIGSVIDASAADTLQVMLVLSVSFATVGLLAAVPAARRASGIDPMTVLRNE